MISLTQEQAELCVSALAIASNECQDEVRMADYCRLADDIERQLRDVFSDGKPLTESQLQELRETIGTGCVVHGVGKIVIVPEAATPIDKCTIDYEKLFPECWDAFFVEKYKELSRQPSLTHSRASSGPVPPLPLADSGMPSQPKAGTV